MLSETSLGTRLFDWILAGDFTTWLAKISTLLVGLWHATKWWKAKGNEDRENARKERLERERIVNDATDNERKSQTQTRLELQQATTGVIDALRTLNTELELAMNRRIADIDRLESDCRVLTQERDDANRKARHEENAHNITKDILKASGFDMKFPHLPE